MNPKISVIMPVFNAERFIAKAIESILKQTFQNFELIIINDGSTDKSETVIQKYNDYRIRYYKYENRGVSATRNLGISMASGDYIALMDADDVSEPNRLKKQLNFLDDNPQIQIVGTNCCHIDEFGNVLNTKTYPKEHDKIEFLAPLFNSICYPSAMFSRKHMIKIGSYKEELLVAGDHELTLRFLLNDYKIFNLQDYLYNYRIVKTSLTSKLLINQKLNHYKSSIEYLNNSKIINNDKKNNFRRALLEYYYGNISTARKFLLLSLKEKSVPKRKVFRILLTSLLGNRFIKFLRSRGISQFINRVFYRLFGINLQEIK